MSGAAAGGGVGRSALAVVAGFVAIVMLSVGTDAVMHATGVFPPADRPMNDTALLGLALAYRSAYNVVGGYLTARLAPRASLRHALILGAFGLVGGMAGVIANMRMHLGPAWYPIGLVLTALPGTWLGGVLYGRSRAAA